MIGIHPTTISESFQRATDRAIKVLTDMSTPVTLSDRESLLKSATTSLSSKVCQAHHTVHACKVICCLGHLYLVNIRFPNITDTILMTYNYVN